MGTKGEMVKQKRTPCVQTMSTMGGGLTPLSLHVFSYIFICKVIFP